MNFRFFSAVALLLIAFLLQFFLASAGIVINLFFAALIAFAFVFTFWELLALMLLAVFIVNWQPAVSPEIVICAAYPLAAFFARDSIHLQPWLKNLAAIFLGFFVLYAAIAGRAFLFHPAAFGVDLLGGLVFGAATFALLRRNA